jgi:hypothetical protein
VKDATKSILWLSFMNKKREFNPTDMHSDGAHFDRDLLESKRNKSDRASNREDDTSDTLKPTVKNKKAEQKETSEDLSENRPNGQS